MTRQNAPQESPNTQTVRLLRSGMVAGPLFLAVWSIEALTRDGFDPSRHPMSLLSLGNLGWIQIANFVLTGALCVVCATGMRRVLHPGRSGTWGPLLVGAFGVGLILAGVFVTDPGAGFPPGAPTGAPEQISWHGALHEIGFIVAQLSWTAAPFVFLRRFATLKERGWVATCVISPLAAFIVAGWPDMASFSLRVAATAIQFVFLTALVARVKRDIPNPARPSAA